MKDWPKVPLCVLPTPIHRLHRISEHLGSDIWIKRDDLTGFALGGNKGRKLEYLMAEAVALGSTAVVSCGASQSNFVRQLGAAAQMCGMRCVVATMDAPYESIDRKVEGVFAQGGNIDLDSLCGVERRRFEDGTWEALESAADGIQQELERAGEKVFRIPLGGSSASAVHAFVEAGREVQGQIDFEFDWIVTASSSGSTHIGLAHAFHGSKTQVLGISADPEPEIVDDLIALSKSYAVEAGVLGLKRDEIKFSLDYVGDGYGVPSLAGEAAMRILMKAEGIALDPIYSAKAFSALLSLVSSNDLEGRILFWHTGGMPSLFARPT